MMEKLKNIPSLRFPEFEGNWEMKKLGEIAEKIGDGLHGTPIYSDDSDIYFINGNNLTNGKIQINENTKKVAKSTFEKNNKGLNKNTILISINGTIGNIAKYNNEKVMLGKSVGYYNFKESSDFYYHVLKSDLIQNFFISELTGSTIKNLSLRTLREAKIPLPTLPEQTKIASFLTAVDEKLQALKQKKTLLEQYKKGVMQKIFSQELRFKDDNGNTYPNWEEKKLGKVLEIQSGFAFKSSLFNKGKTKVIRIGNIEPNIYLENFDGAFSKEIPDLKYLVKKDDFLMALSGATFGKVGKVKDDGIGYINQRVALFRTKENLEYYYQLVQTDKFRNYISSIPTASAQPNISNGDILNYETFIPSLHEQTKIGNFLSAIDDKINYCGVQIEKTEVWKKGLLQQLFC